MIKPLLDARYAHHTLRPLSSKCSLHCADSRFPSRTRNKVKILGGDYKDALLEVLKTTQLAANIDDDTVALMMLTLGLGVPAPNLNPNVQVIDEENLPEEYGGKSTCEGGCVPGGGKFCDQKDDGTSYNPLQATVGRKGAPPPASRAFPPVTANAG